MVKNRKEDNKDRALVLFPYLSLHLNQKGVQLTWNANLTGLEYWTASSKAKEQLRYGLGMITQIKRIRLYIVLTHPWQSLNYLEKKGWRSKKAKSIQLHLQNS